MKIDDVEIKMSICQKCGGAVRAAVSHLMDDKDEQEFNYEVKRYNLTVKTVPLVEYRQTKINWCKCPN